MSSEEDFLRVRKIERGTVIDHVSPGTALKVLRILGVTGSEGYVVSILMNVESKKYGKKDIIKLEDRFLTEEEVDKIALVSPNATINIVDGFRVVRKWRVSVPERAVGILRCPNPRCVTNSGKEPVKTEFKLRAREPLEYECEYCGILLKHDEIPEWIR